MDFTLIPYPSARSVVFGAGSCLYRLLMPINNIVAQIDAEIARLQQAKSLLAATGVSADLPAVRRGRPKKNEGTPAAPKPAKMKRILSPEGRARLVEAVKRRWAAQKANKKAKG
jgi:hypothetical protein